MQNIVWKLKKLINYQKCYYYWRPASFFSSRPRIGLTRSSKFIVLCIKSYIEHFSRLKSNPVKLFYSSRQFEFVDNFLTFLAINHLVPSSFIAILKTKHWKYPSELQNEMIDFMRSFDTICSSDLFLVLTISSFDFSCHFLSNFSYINSSMIENL